MATINIPDIGMSNFARIPRLFKGSDPRSYCDGKPFYLSVNLQEAGTYWYPPASTPENSWIEA